MTDEFSIENMKTEQARAINKQADTQAMIDEWKHTDETDPSIMVIDMYNTATKLINAIANRNNQL